MLSVILFFMIGMVGVNRVKTEITRRSSSNDIGEVVFVNVLFRHGDRTPYYFYPNDPYTNKSYWPDGIGQLTNIGKQQAYELGVWLRNRYDLLLSEEYSVDTLHVESTDYERTISSAQCVLAGMYPPKSRQIWNPTLNWQPIPIHTVPKTYDKKFSEAKCPTFKKEYETILQSNEIQGLNSKFSDVFSVLNNYTGEHITNLQYITKIFSTLYIEDLYNLTLPAWTKSIYPDRIEEASNYGFPLQTWTTQLAKLKSGLLIEDMILHMKQKINETEDKIFLRMWMYSAHDSTISNLLNSLKVFDPQFPPYSSAVLMELGKSTRGEYHVTLFYRNSTTHKPYLLTVPGCTSVCPLDRFLELCEPLIIEDWDKECGNK